MKMNGTIMMLFALLAGTVMGSEDQGIRNLGNSTKPVHNGDIRVLISADSESRCMNRKWCKNAVMSFSYKMALQTDLYDPDWYHSDWHNYTLNNRRALRGGEEEEQGQPPIEVDEEMQADFDQLFTFKSEQEAEKDENARRELGMSCSACIAQYGARFLCVQYGYCNRRHLQDSIMSESLTTDETVMLANDKCFKDVGVDFDNWLYAVVQWFALQRGVTHLTKAISYRVQHRKCNADPF